ncbi:MAG TPA: hypothetical protein VKH61_19975, partial [Streptosporangiaceae bacterium]|nr:hypothetical protein [Streptosporangiaceae bacterium]
YFAVIADSQALADIVAASPTGSTSMKQFFGMWFSKPPSPGPSRSRDVAADAEPGLRGGSSTEGG